MLLLIITISKSLFDFENVIGALDDECYREYKYRNDVEKIN